MLQRKDKKALDFEINENALFSDRDLLCFAGVNNAIVILPTPINSEFLQYFLDTFGNKDFEVWSPKKTHGFTKPRNCKV